MAKPQQSKRRQERGRPRRDLPPENRGVEAITVAWTVSVTAVFLADVITIAAYLYSRAHPESRTAPAFEGIMLLTASVMGFFSLVLLPAVWRLRTIKPPTGFAVFAALVAAAPVVTLIGRLLSNGP